MNYNIKLINNSSRVSAKATSLRVLSNVSTLILESSYSAFISYPFVYSLNIGTMLRFKQNIHKYIQKERESITESIFITLNFVYEERMPKEKYITINKFSEGRKKEEEIQQ
ncbi:hypothetical protein Avbf_03717 [Armadillidium vulgare]|nr:hypothetical protein Avbf_03717 [Armadillidium vulgare]